MNPIITDWLARDGGLAQRLRELRAKAGLPGIELAKRAGWNQSKVSRLENGKHLPSADDLQVWAEACGVPDATASLLEQLDEAQSVHLDWKRRATSGFAAIQATYNALVEDAKVVRHFEVTFVPGLLQTADYARYLLTNLAGLDVDAEVDAEIVEVAVSLRMQRQQALYDPMKRFEFLVSESVLRWLLVPRSVMVGQLDRLQTVTGLPNVRFGIVPFGVELAVAPQNKFEVYDQAAVVESFVGETVHRDAESAAYLRILERLWGEAVEGESARRLIIRALRDLQVGSGESSAT